MVESRGENIAGSVVGTDHKLLCVPWGSFGMFMFGRVEPPGSSLRLIARAPAQGEPWAADFREFLLLPCYNESSSLSVKWSQRRYLQTKPLVSVSVQAGRGAIPGRHQRRIACVMHNA